MQAIRNLEMHLVHSCNLACEGCSHYSNQEHKGIVSVEEAQRWMQAWNGRIDPATFSLLGGEPSLHPRLPAFVELARRQWPRAALRLVSNGFFLHRHPDLPLVLRDDPEANLIVSIHHAGPEYRKRFEAIQALLDGWVAKYGIRVAYYASWENWTRRYLGEGAAMQPFRDGAQRLSWEHCSARTFPQLHEGRIWKCGALAYLPMQNAKYRLGPEWRSYLDYRPLEADCSDAELREFFSREDEPQCGMCPAYPQRFVLPSPLIERSGGQAAV